MKASFLERLKAALFVFNNMQDCTEYGVVYSYKTNNHIVGTTVKSFERHYDTPYDADEAFESGYPTRHRKDELSMREPPELVLFIRPVKEY